MAKRVNCNYLPALLTHFAYLLLRYSTMEVVGYTPADIKSVVLQLLC